MAGELLKPASGMLVLRGDRGGTALLGLLVEETHVVHGGGKSLKTGKVPLKRRLGSCGDADLRFYFRRFGGGPVLAYRRADQTQVSKAQSVMATRSR